jgi:hypothetical protein
LLCIKSRRTAVWIYWFYICLIVWYRYRYLLYMVFIDNWRLWWIFDRIFGIQTYGISGTLPSVLQIYRIYTGFFFKDYPEIIKFKPLCCCCVPVRYRCVFVGTGTVIIDETGAASASNTYSLDLWWQLQSPNAMSMVWEGVGRASGWFLLVSPFPPPQLEWHSDVLSCGLCTDDEFTGECCYRWRSGRWNNGFSEQQTSVRQGQSSTPSVTEISKYPTMFIPDLDPKICSSRILHKKNDVKLNLPLLSCLRSPQ